MVDRDRGSTPRTSIGGVVTGVTPGTNSPARLEGSSPPAAMGASRGHGDKGQATRDSLQPHQAAPLAGFSLTPGW